MKKNSLVENINRRKKNGTSRSKADSTVSPENYRNLQTEWGQKPLKKAAKKKKS